MSSENGKTPTQQGDYEVGNKKPPKNRQFGQPEGNPRHNGSWHKEDTARYKMETIMKMSDEELLKTKEEGATTFERAFANVLYLARTATDVEEAKKCMDILEKMTNQVYGPMPQVQVAVEADEETSEEASKFIRGFALP
jgi:uncharacterized protein with NRDE domain